jgi:CRP-like cAMP-binding protein
LIKISAAGFEELLSELPVWAQSMLKNFSTRLRETNALIKNSKLK